MITDIAGTRQEGAEDWVDYILRIAIQNRASDVHFEPQQDGLDVRFRIDGLLYPVSNFLDYSYVKGDVASIITRIKVLSQMDISEHRFPQDGHYKFTNEERVYNVRVSTFPTTDGETVVLRILNREDTLLKLDSLGLDQIQLDIVRKLISNPYGMILITGPTGSGKTTLLYSILNTIRKPTNNIVTLEDPIELQMSSIRQVQIKDSIGLSFAKAMRSVVRQDPDVIMLGEIRDPDTAQMAMQAALIGILVLSTFHTLDVPGLVTRFIEMGIPRSVVIQAIAGVVSTRLVRKICQSCKTPYTLSDYEKKVIGENYATSTFQKGKGCHACNGSGYLGRIGIFETVYFDDEVRSCIFENQTASALYKIIKEKKIKSLRESAIEKVIQSVTTAEEVIRVTGLPF